VDFFEDDATSQPAAPPRRRRTSNRRRTQVQRLAFLVVVLFLIVFGLVLWVRSCQLNNKRSSYRTYFANVSTAIADSNKLDARLAKLITNPTPYRGNALTTELTDLRKKQQEIDTRVKGFSVPDKLKDLQYIFVRGMDVRLAGYTRFETAVLAAVAKQKGVTAASIASLGGYFTGPDAYYTSLVYTQARQIMQADGVTDVTVPTMTYFASRASLFLATRITTMLSSLTQVASTGGVHGVALGDVIAMPSNTRLVKGTRNPIKADVNLAFVVTVQNQGGSAETNVPVTVTLTMPGSQPQKITATIASIAKGKSRSVSVKGFTVPTSALTQVSSVKIYAGPVPGEKVLSNNTATYQILLSLSA
jgi:hypothetical protein